MFWFCFSLKVVRLVLLMLVLIGLLFRASLHYCEIKNKAHEIFLGHLMMILIMKFLKKGRLSPLLKVWQNNFQILPSFSVRPIYLKPLKLPNVWRPRNFEHTVKPTADTCGHWRKHPPRKSFRHTETPRPFSQEVNFPNSVLPWPISRKSIPVMWFASWKRHYMNPKSDY